MYPYFILLLMPIAFNLFFINKINEKKNRRLTLWLFFFLYFLLLALRSEKIGTDLKTYKYYYNEYGNLSWKSVFGKDDEVGYAVLCKLIYLTGANFQCFLVIIAIIEILPITILYEQESENAILSMVLFLNIGLFPVLFSGLRQSIALSLGALAYIFLKNKKLILFFLIICVAYTIHISAFILVFLLPLYYMKLTKKWMIFIIPFLLVIMVFNRQIFTFLSMLLPEKYGRYNMSETNGYMMLVLYIVLSVFSYVVLDEDRVGKDVIGLRNILLFTVVLQMFAPIHTLAMRMNYYFIIFTPLTISKVVSSSKQSMVQVSLTAKYVIIIFFVYYFVYAAYTSADILNIYPYQFFWE